MNVDQLDPKIKLNEDQTAVATRYINDLYFAFSTLKNGIEKNNLPADLAENCLKVAEFKLADLCKVLSVETNGRAERENRNAQLREANMKIHALEALVGSSQSPELLQLGVNALHERLNKWWDAEGFGHISELNFGPYGIQAKFCCSLYGGFRLIDSDTPISDQEKKAQWYAELTERGFELCMEAGEREPSIRDCDKNRDALISLFEKHMPSAEVISFNSHGRRKVLVLRDVNVFIRKYEDVHKLSVPEK